MNHGADARFMALALSLGRRGQGRCWPNPAVGCVIVKDGVIVGRGRTADGGRPHAETQALIQAGGAAKGATAYVTLEPCSHQGQTPPCAKALINSGISRCVVALGDPDPRVNGRGIAMLRAAGIDVGVGLCADQAADDLAGYVSRTTASRPFLTLKLATTIDGRIATATGDSQWITGPQARRAVHAMRARHDAVMVGGGTARADDPMLDVRDMGADRQPVRVVLSRDLNLPLDGKLALSARTQPLWLCHGAGADATPWQALGARTLDCGDMKITRVLNGLAAQGLTSIYCEGGAALAADLVAHGVVDALIAFTGGRLIGLDGLGAVGLQGAEKLNDAPAYQLTDVTRLGPDVMARWTPTR